MNNPERDSLESELARALSTSAATVDPDVSNRLFARLSPMIVDEQTRISRRGRTHAIGAVAAAGMLAATVALVIGRPDPAYAVTQLPDGSTEIIISRLDDAEGLQRDLAAAGIRAKVTYNLDEARGGGAFVERTDPNESPPDAAKPLSHADVITACGFDRPEQPYTAGRAGDDYVLTIPARSVLREYELLIATTTINGGMALEVTYWVGPVACGSGSAVNYLD